MVIHVNQLTGPRVFISGKGTKAPEPDQIRVSGSIPVADLVEVEVAKRPSPVTATHRAGPKSRPAQEGQGSMHYANRRSVAQSVLVSACNDGVTLVRDLSSFSFAVPR